MAKLAAFLTDTRAINQGAWVRVSDALYDDLEIFSRGFTDEFVDAQAARQRRTRLDLNLSEAEALPNAIMREINASLLGDFLVHDVRNLEGDDGQPVAIEAFKAMLAQPNASRLARACWEAAARVSTRTAKATEAALGN